MREALPDKFRKVQRNDAGSPIGSRSAVMHSPDYCFHILVKDTVDPLPVHVDYIRKDNGDGVNKPDGIFSIASR